MQGLSSTMYIVKDEQGQKCRCHLDEQGQKCRCHLDHLRPNVTRTHY